MANKGLGIYAEADDRLNQIKTIFTNNGYAASDFDIAAISLEGRDKQTTTAKGTPVKVKRLRFSGYDPIHSENSGLCGTGDCLHVLWIGHSQYTTHGGEKSIKFLPHYKTSHSDNYLLSAKEVARIIYNLLTEYACPYPNYLTIASCFSGFSRTAMHLENVHYRDSDSNWVPKENVKMKTSGQEIALGLRVADHLRASFTPAPDYTCTVSVPQTAIPNLSLANMRLPPEALPATWTQSKI